MLVLPFCLKLHPIWYRPLLQKNGLLICVAYKWDMNLDRWAKPYFCKFSGASSLTEVCAFCKNQTNELFHPSKNPKCQNTAGCYLEMRNLWDTEKFYKAFGVLSKVWFCKYAPGTLWEGPQAIAQAVVLKDKTFQVSILFFLSLSCTSRMKGGKRYSSSDRRSSPEKQWLSCRISELSQAEEYSSKQKERNMKVLFHESKLQRWTETVFQHKPDR